MQFPSRTLRWLKDGWEGEFVSDLGPPLVLHVHGGKQRAGALVHRVVRILEQRHIEWQVERDLNTPPGYKGRGLAPKKDSKGRVLRRQGEWLQPFHEAVKRLAPRHADEHPSLRFYWLVAYLRDRGLPCPCAHRDVIEHLAREAMVEQKVVQMSIERAARHAARTIGDRVPDNPQGVRYPYPVAKSMQKAHSAVQHRHASDAPNTTMAGPTRPVEPDLVSGEF